jgi:uncharacterized membrane-anchored protein YjiN (DUF445 family)
VEKLRNYLLHDEKLAVYLRELWAGWRARLERDLADENSAMARRAAVMGRWLGQALAHDEALRSSMNERLKRWATTLAPMSRSSSPDILPTRCSAGMPSSWPR